VHHGLARAPSRSFARASLARPRSIESNQSIRAPHRTRAPRPTSSSARAPREAGAREPTIARRASRVARARGRVAREPDARAS
jgi:hypothetical protein